MTNDFTILIKVGMGLPLPQTRDTPKPPQGDFNTL